MVCIPCIIAPVLLFIWYRFIQPIVLKFWNPWATKKSVKNTSNSQTTEGEKSSCPFANKTLPEVTETTEQTSTTAAEVVGKESSSKKSD